MMHQAFKAMPPSKQQVMQAMSNKSSKAVKESDIIPKGIKNELKKGEKKIKTWC